jgi:hypothetical protein
VVVPKLRSAKRLRTKGAAKQRPPESLLAEDPSWQAAYRLRLGKRRRRQIAAGTALALVVAMMVVVLHPGPTDVTVPLTFDQSSYGAAFDPPPIIDVTIGQDHVVPVLLDTGSVGLHIFANAISASSWPGVKVWSERETVQTLDGTLWSGTCLGDLAIREPENEERSSFPAHRR